MIVIAMVMTSAANRVLIPTLEATMTRKTNSREAMRMTSSKHRQPSTSTESDNKYRRKLVDYDDKDDEPGQPRTVYITNPSTGQIRKRFKSDDNIRRQRAQSDSNSNLENKDNKEEMNGP